MLFASLSIPTADYQVETPPGFELLYSPTEDWRASGQVRAVPSCAPRGVLNVSSNTIKTWFCWLTPCDAASSCEQRCWPAMSQCQGDNWQPWASTTEMLREPWRWPQERARIASQPSAGDTIGHISGGSYGRSSSGLGGGGRALDVGSCRP
jgi:hypothetical protein